jgi:hypothetical protein
MIMLFRVEDTFERNKVGRAIAYFKMQILLYLCLSH